MTQQLILIDTSAKLTRWPDYPAADIRTGTRANFGRMLFEDKLNGLSVGLWQQEANETNWLDYPIDEFMIVLEGEVVIEEEGRRTTITAGESFVIPKGLRCRWTQKDRVRKIFVILENDAVPKGRDRHVIKIDTAGPLEKSDPPASSVLLSSPPPAQHAREDYATPGDAFTVGLWSTTPYTRKVIPFPRFELMHILEGSVTMSDGAGRHDIISEGETIFVPQGAANGWQSHGDLKKIFCIYQP